MTNSIWNYKINKARSLNASDAIYTMYFYDLEKEEKEKRKEKLPRQ